MERDDENKLLFVVLTEFADSAVAKRSVLSREKVREQEQEQEMQTISEQVGDTSDFGTMPQKTTIITTVGKRYSKQVQVS